MAIFNFLLFIILCEAICYEYLGKNINKMNRKYVIYRRFLNCTQYTNIEHGASHKPHNILFS